ncbi:MAG: hypothetical protein QW666_02095, partial [Candidatus Woesearchaeota archaeon]
MKHIIYVTPHQLKAKPTLGSIFDWTIAQFYADVCANKGEEVILLHLWNANGLHTINQLQSAGIKPTPTSIETILANNIDLNKKYWI